MEARESDCTALFIRLRTLNPLCKQLIHMRLCFSCRTKCTDLWSDQSHKVCSRFPRFICVQHHNSCVQDLTAVGSRDFQDTFFVDKAAKTHRNDSGPSSPKLLTRSGKKKKVGFTLPSVCCHSMDLLFIVCDTESLCSVRRLWRRFKRGVGKWSLVEGRAGWGRGGGM